MKNNPKSVDDSPVIVVVIGMALLIQWLFILYNKKNGIASHNYPIPNEINIPWHFP